MDAVINNQDTSLIQVASNLDVDKVEELLKNGAEIDAKNSRGKLESVELVLYNVC